MRKLFNSIFFLVIAMSISSANTFAAELEVEGDLTVTGDIIVYNYNSNAPTYQAPEPPQNSRTAQ